MVEQLLLIRLSCELKSGLRQSRLRACVTHRNAWLAGGLFGFQAKQPRSSQPFQSLISHHWAHTPLVRLNSAPTPSLPSRFHHLLFRSDQIYLSCISDRSGIDHRITTKLFIVAGLNLPNPMLHVSTSLAAHVFWARAQSIGMSVIIWEALSTRRCPKFRFTGLPFWKEHQYCRMTVHLHLHPSFQEPSLQVCD